MSNEEPKYLPVADMHERLTGYRPSNTAVDRMKRAGLKTWLISGRRMTTREEMQAMIDRTMKVGRPETPAKESDEFKEALAELDAELG